MKIAITGKGGVGKTTLAAALARTFARWGNPVVAVDADPNPNLGIALGVGIDETDRLDAVANALLREREPHRHEEGGHDHGPALEPEQEAERLLAELGILAPDGVRLLQTGRIERPSDGCLCCGSHRATRQVFGDLSGHERVVLADLEAGVTDLCWTDPKPEDAVVIVATPDRSSIEIARRAMQVTRDLDVGHVLVVANRLDEAGDAEGVRELLPGVEVLGIPEDAAIADAERRGLSPFDVDPECAAVQGVRTVAARLLGR